MINYNSSDNFWGENKQFVTGKTCPQIQKKSVQIFGQIWEKIVTCKSRAFLISKEICRLVENQKLVVGALVGPMLVALVGIRGHPWWASVKICKLFQPMETDWVSQWRCLFILPLFIGNKESFGWCRNMFYKRVVADFGEKSPKIGKFGKFFICRWGPH